MAGWLSQQGKDYNRSVMHEQLGLKERERGQQLAHGAYRWSLWMVERRNLVSHFNALVDASQALRIPCSYSES